ncbi:MAG: nicotinate (nicotinamide) nucleotide adenylyltransferase [Ignavibacteriae bacterium]|nr:nicotinate (nicotinamide) nucleotide adenylyltransferase [Ignavibacteriota bacterium]
MPEKKKRIGIIGGSFNPIHVAHYKMAECFVQDMKCDVCYFVPAALSPLKRDDNYASSEHRLAMVQLAIQDNPFFRFCDEEIKRGGVSYTIDTIRWFQEQFPESTLFLLIGADQAKEFPLWKRWKEIIDAVQLCIINRQGIVEKDVITQVLSIDSKKPLWINCPVMNVSSSMIRENIRNQKSISSLVSKKVENYILKNKLYV